MKREHSCCVFSVRLFRHFFPFIFFFSLFLACKFVGTLRPGFKRINILKKIILASKGLVVLKKKKETNTFFVQL